MIAIDSSIAIAAFGEWHQDNGRARAVLDAGAALPAHALLETYSVLTGFPPPHRAAPHLVEAWITDRFDHILAPPPAPALRALVATLAAAGRSGGAIYDGLVALTAKLAGATMVTLDVRATSVYKLVGVDFRVP